MITEIKNDAKERMKKSTMALNQNLTKIRTGRANTSLLDQITVDYYGSETALSQVSNISIEDSRTLKITPWEKDMIQPIEKAIMKANIVACIVIRFEHGHIHVDEQIHADEEIHVNE